jgi:hypothetical protein
MADFGKDPASGFTAVPSSIIRGLDEAVGRLFNARRLSSRWQIVLTYSDPDNPDTTFSLQPDPGPETFLSSLQGGLRVLADEPGRTFWLVCDALAAQAR